MKIFNKKKLLILLASKFAWLLILLFGRMGRIFALHRRYWDQLEYGGKSFIALLWHGKMLLPMYVHRHENLSVMISEHQDGELIAQNVIRMGYVTARGSSTRGGSKALRNMLRQLKDGINCVILPDGPRGPRHEVKSGAILLAQLSGAPLIPVTFSAQKPIVLKSWDRFTFWWPFSRLCIAYGAPITIPRHINADELEKYRRLVENSLKSLQEEADAVF